MDIRFGLKLTYIIRYNNTSPICHVQSYYNKDTIYNIRYNNTSPIYHAQRYYKKDTIYNCYTVCQPSTNLHDIYSKISPEPWQKELIFMLPKLGKHTIEMARNPRLKKKYLARTKLEQHPRKPRTLQPANRTSSRWLVNISFSSLQRSQKLLRAQVSITVRVKHMENDVHHSVSQFNTTDL
jgi:hypothetical protein